MKMFYEPTKTEIRDWEKVRKDLNKLQRYYQIEFLEVWGNWKIKLTEKERVGNE